MSSKKKNGLLNPKREPLTPEKLRELSGLNLSDEQAEEVIESLTRYAQILYDSIAQREKPPNAKSNQTSND
jgi:hypothetical protein